MVQERQTRYAVACIKGLREHYSRRHQADLPVILVGHSMGGVVARAAALAMEADVSTSADCPLGQPLSPCLAGCSRLYCSPGGLL